MSAVSGAEVRLDDIVRYLDGYLHLSETADAPEALNGLQVENEGRVSRLGAAVDACEATIRMAAVAQVDLLLVHHGLYWSGLRPLTGPHFARVAGLIRGRIALYSAHLPLDRHPDVGNAAVLARSLGCTLQGEFGHYRGQAVGVWGEIDIPRDELQRRLAQTLGSTPRLLGFGPERANRVGIVTGAGGSLIGQAADAGLDTFLTGEVPHWSFLDAEERHLNLLLAGHYATETVGVKALAEHLAARFHLPWVFLDHPTGL